MEITWYGHACFRLSERGLASVVTDPYDPDTVGYQPYKIRGDIITISQDTPERNFIKGVRGVQRVIEGPGEFEIGGGFITAVTTNGSRKKDQDDPRNILYVFDYGGVNVAHLGNLNRVPTQTQVEALGTVHVALVPVGDDNFNAAKAAEVISLIEPGIVIPMLYNTPGSKVKLNSLSRFLKEMGLGSKVEAEESLKITRNSVPTETRVVVLACANK